MNKLGQLLVTRGWISVQQLTRALKNQQAVGGQLGTCLLEMEALSEDLLLKGLAEQLGVPAASVDDLRSVAEDALALLPPKVARRCRAVPIRVAGGRLDVAMLDPHNLTAQDELAFATGKRVRVHVLHEARIHEALDRYYGEEPPLRFVHLLDRLNRARYLWERESEEGKPVAAAQAAATRGGRPGPVAAAPARPIEGEWELSLPELSEPEPPPARAAKPQPVAAPPAPKVAPKPVPAAEPPAPAEPEPARPRTVALTIAERAALGAGPGKAAPPPALASLPELEEALTAAAQRDEIGRLVVAFLAPTYRRVALLQVARGQVAGWLAQGEGIDPERFARFAVGFDQPSVFLNLRQGSGLHLGPLADMPAHRELAACWGGQLPRECLLLPIRLRDRLVSVLYLDAAGGPLGRVDLEGLQRLAAAAARALERLILQKKKGSAAR
jgi:Type II secretion system (T2SS), protein E, N-terminal domain